MIHLNGLLSLPQRVSFSRCIPPVCHPIRRHAMFTILREIRFSCKRRRVITRNAWAKPMFGFDWGHHWLRIPIRISCNGQDFNLSFDFQFVSFVSTPARRKYIPDQQIGMRLSIAKLTCRLWDRSKTLFQLPFSLTLYQFPNWAQCVAHSKNPNRTRNDNETFVRIWHFPSDSMKEPNEWLDKIKRLIKFLHVIHRDQAQHWLHISGLCERALAIVTRQSASIASTRLCSADAHQCSLNCKSQNNSEFAYELWFFDFVRICNLDTLFSCCSENVHNTYCAWMIQSSAGACVCGETWRFRLRWLVLPSKLIKFTLFIV